MAVRWNSGTVYGAVVYVHAATRVCAGVEENTRVYSVPDRLIFQGRCQHHHHHHQVLAIDNLSHALPIPMSLLKQRRTCTRKASYSSLANNASHTARCRYVSRAYVSLRLKNVFPSFAKSWRSKIFMARHVVVELVPSRATKFPAINSRPWNFHDASTIRDLRSLLPSQLAPSIRRVPHLEEPIHLVSRLANLWTSYAIIKPNVRENL